MSAKVSLGQLWAPQAARHRQTSVNTVENRSDSGQHSAEVGLDLDELGQAIVELVPNSVEPGTHVPGACAGVAQPCAS